MDVVCLVIEHNQIGQVFQSLERAAPQEPSVQHIESIPSARARSEREATFDCGLRVDLSARCFDLVIVEKVGVLLARE